MGKGLFGLRLRSCMGAPMPGKGSSLTASGELMLDDGDMRIFELEPFCLLLLLLDVVFDVSGFMKPM